MRGETDAEKASSTFQNQNTLQIVTDVSWGRGRGEKMERKYSTS